MASANDVGQKVKQTDRLNVNGARCRQQVPNGDFISALNEYAARRRLVRPSYITNAAGPGLFQVRCVFQNASNEGFGASKKIAKRQAAKAAWERLESTPVELKQRCLNPKDKGQMRSNSPEKGPAMMKKKTLKEQPKVIELGKNTLGVSESNSKNPKKENLGSPFSTLPISAQQKKQSKVDPSSVTIQKGHQENRKEPVSYVGMLQDYCLKNDLQAPKYYHHPVKGDKRMFTMTCNFQDHKFTVYRESLKRCKTAAAKEMLVKLNVISPPKPVRKIDGDLGCGNNSIGINSVKILQDYCLDHSGVIPCFRYKKMEGKPGTIVTTCSYQAYQVEVSGEHLSKCRQEAAEQMLLKIKATSSEKNNSGLAADTKYKRAKSVGKPKSEGTHVETSTYQGSKTKPEVVKPSVRSNRKILSGCRTKSEDLEIKKLLDLACVKEGYCCHQEFKKIGLHSWVTNNRIQSGPSLTFMVSRTRRTLESSIAVANQLTLEAFKVFVMDNSD